MDEIVIFNRLTEEDFVKIAALMLGELKEPLADKGITLVWEDKALRLLAHKAHGKQGGAHDLRRLIRKEVEDKICSLLVAPLSEPACRHQHRRRRRQGCSARAGLKKPES